MSWLGWIFARANFRYSVFFFHLVSFILYIYKRFCFQVAYVGGFIFDGLLYWEAYFKKDLLRVFFFFCSWSLQSEGFSYTFSLLETALTLFQQPFLFQYFLGEISQDLAGHSKTSNYEARVLLIESAGITSGGTLLTVKLLTFILLRSRFRKTSFMFC